jgi:hypothetical protein
MNSKKRRNEKMIDNTTTEKISVSVMGIDKQPVTIEIRKLTRSEVEKFFYEDFKRYYIFTAADIQGVFLNLYRLEEFWNLVLDREEVEKIGLLTSDSLRSLYREFALFNSEFELFKASFIGIAHLSEMGGVMIQENDDPFVLSIETGENLHKQAMA